MIKILLNILQSKVPLLGLSLFFTFITQAQIVTFKEPVRNSVQTQQVVELNGQFYSVGQFYDNSISRWGVNLLKLDSSGSLIKERKFLDTFSTVFPSAHISLEKTFQGDFASVFIKSQTPRLNGILIFNQNLDTLNYFLPIQDSKQRLFYQLKQTLDSGFVITGYLFENNMYHANLIRTDKDGQLLWEQVY